MPWCPVCKNEYKEGISRCADCNVDLVEELEKETKAVYFGERQKLETMNEFLKENGVQSGNITLDEGEQVYELFVAEPDLKKAVQILGIFLQEEEEENENREEEQPKKQKIEPAAVYVDKKYRADEYKTSAYTLFFVGVLGIVFLICMGFGVLPFFQLSTTTKLMMYVVLGTLFLVFLGFGVYSIKAYKRILAESDEEEDKIKEVEAHLKKCVTKEAINASLAGQADKDQNPEALYFAMTEVIEEEIQKTFPDLEEALVAKLAEDHYTRLYD